MYVSLESLRDYISTTQETHDSLLEDSISAAQGEIDEICNTRFAGSTGTRYYRPDDLLYIQNPNSGYGEPYGLDQGRTWYQSSIYSRRVLLLHNDLLSLGGLTNGDGTTIASTDCWLEPRNQPPYQSIRLKSAVAWSFGTDGEITVSGTWGASTAAPSVVQQYTREVAAYLYRARSAQTFEVVANPESGTITIPKSMRAALEKNLNRAGLVRRWPLL